MGDKTGISWTDATWNPTTGCTHVSPGCDRCYAASLASGRLAHLPAYKGLAEGGRFNGTVRLLPDRLDQPLRWKRPRRIFVNSMSDLWHKEIPDEFLAKVFAVMALAPQHQFQVLTKRPGRMRSFLSDLLMISSVMKAANRLGLDGRLPLDVAWPLPNVWLGVSAEDQHWADIRIPILLETPAAVRFVSAEPLLGPVDLGRWTGRRSDGKWLCTRCCNSYLCPDHLYRPDGCPRCGGSGAATGLDWVIVGGESGRGARVMDLDWARRLRDQCADAGVAFLYKQQGSGDGGRKDRKSLDGCTWEEFPA